MGRSHSIEIRFMGVAESYIKYLSARNLSQGTIRNRLYILKVFSGFLDRREPSYDLILDFIEYKKETWNGQTLHQSVWVLKQFFCWAYNNNHYRQDFGKQVPYPKFSFNERKIPSWDDAIKVINYRRGNAITKWASQMDLIFHLLIRTGMRPSECLKLRVENFNWNAGVILILETKTGGFRAVPIPQDISGKLRRSLAHREPRAYVFTGKQGNQYRAYDLSRELRTRKKEMGVGFPLSAYTFRHLFATEMLRQGCPIDILAKLLGHQDLSTTQVYTHYVHEDLKDALMTYHPLVSRGTEPSKKIELLKERIRRMKLESDLRMKVTQKERKGYYQLEIVFDDLVEGN